MCDMVTLQTCLSLHKNFQHPLPLPKTQVSVFLGKTFSSDYEILVYTMY